MLAAIDMENRRIENIAPARHGFNDAVSSLHLHNFYYNLNVDDGYIEAQNPIDMQDQRIKGVAEPIHHKDAATKFYIDNFMTQKADKTDLANYLKLNGSQDMSGNLNMNNKQIVNLADPIGINDATGKGYVDRLFLDSLRLDGSSQMSGDLNMNNQRIINLGNATHNQDAITLKQVNDAFSTISTENNKYTDQKIAESHISTHENRKNVLKYAMDDEEFTEDYGIQDVNLITFNDMPHKTNNKAFSMKVQKANNGEYKGRFDFNLFKMIRDDFDQKNTVCLEFYFQKTPFYSYAFDSVEIGYEGLNINVDSGTTIKANSEYKYHRTILNLSPNGTSPTIQRRLYVNFKSNFDNASPALLPIFVLIYGIKGEAKSNLDMTIYDYELAYQVVNNEFQLHVPLNMNGNKILGLFNEIYPSLIFGVTAESALGCNFEISPGADLSIDKIYIEKIKIHAKKNYPSDTNHNITFYSKNSTFYDIDFSSSKILTVNIDRYFENITNIRVNFEDDDGDGVRSYIYNIQYKTFLLN